MAKCGREQPVAVTLTSIGSVTRARQPRAQSLGNAGYTGSNRCPYFRTNRQARRGSVLFAWLKGLFLAAQVIVTKWAGAEAEEWKGMDRMIRAVLALVTALTLVSTVARAADTSTTRDARQPEYQTLFAQLEKTDVVQEGAKEAKSVLYVFFDANCFYCHLTWKALQPYETVGLQVRWLPVAYQQPSSVGRAAAIMQASDRIAALRVNELGDLVC